MKVIPMISGRTKGGDFVNDDDTFGMARRLDVPVWVFDVDNGCILFANSAACALWQAENEEELCARDFWEDMSETVFNRLKQYQNDFLQSDAMFNEMWTLYPNGEPKNVMVIYRGYVLADGRMAIQCEVAGERSDSAQNLRSTEALLYTDVMISLFSNDGRPLYLNPAARMVFPSPINNFADVFKHSADYTTLWQALAEKGEHRFVTKLYTSIGEKWFDLSVKTCTDAATGVPAVLTSAFDVSALREARDQARHLANRDQLTDLFNRTYLQSHLSTLAQDPLLGDCAMVFLDIDRFKTINDRFGHDAGDTVLIEIAHRLRKSLRDDDLVVRLGGDELVVLLENISGPDEVAQRTDRLFRAVCQPVILEKAAIDVAISIGISIFKPQTADFTEVLREADIALYASKQDGRGRWTFFTQEMGDEAKARDDLEIELKAAVENKEFVLHYQPRLDLPSGKIVAVEGLARWHHPERGIVMPNVFISVCEETGLIEELGKLVIELGFEQAVDWQKSGLDINVSLNVSPRQFNDDSLMETLAELSQRPDFPAGKIELEITESALVGDHAIIAEKLRLISTMGYRIAIDDFGTGYSNLSYISRFPLTCLKIDRSFIEQLPSSGPIVRLILTLGQQIGATVVSEGVETIEQLDWLTENGCAQAQGYLITPPLPPNRLMSFLAHSAY